MVVLRALKALDAYPKTLPDAKAHSKTGGALTLVVVVLTLWLFSSATVEYLSGTTVYDAAVDTERTAHQQVVINLDMTIATRCEFLSADVVDVTGAHDGDGMHELQHQPVKWAVDVPSADKVDSFWKTQKSALLQLHDVIRLAGIRMPLAGLPVAASEKVGGKPPSLAEIVRKSATGHEAEGEAHKLPLVAIDKKSSNSSQLVKPDSKPTPDDIANLRRQVDGNVLPTAHVDASFNACRLFGHLTVSKVRGNFHITAGRSIERGGGHVHDMHSVPAGALNFTHRIHRLSFGENFPGIVAPADTLVYHTTHSLQMYQYFVKVVPTLYKASAADVVDTNQYSLTANSRAIDHSRGQHGMPGIFFNYEFEPVRITVSETYSTFLHFITRCCAIIGGVYAVSGMLVTAINALLDSVAVKLGHRRGILKL
ncbi:endoplasmic reticulum-Golgi intermediate compartment protein 3 [Thecamonas trahens ATCC 50062]|uniref:Endoplasmic reticulum-Golgi intermediate compartment protein 3 n=1 Tax=Thecamonas trahens ATCC 50062 TaxID=461836 RepID=A0A0L0D923_THETB|nr:endoplasmic reticulum-Golgi intermediate compartment protein 3 [Thecamonas trahens ATCC 50062]KNC47798.1 endoplasmic reticulum-Golgi intermediate compartment protein 3 [Thecamonas trahens ATCC 50062]|eukprot:XP_013759276.1 endoplasmic reticulum-Golgi intermediate compartment protein 3 [Thecamonas trahens ATCC 50062]